MKRAYILIAGISLLIFACYLIVFPDVKSGESFTREDGLIETLGALAFGWASLCFAWIFYRSRIRKGHIPQDSIRRNYWYLGLSLMFLFACGEEISWGQRIFGWETPQNMLDTNLQQETNLHNLEIFSNTKKEGEEKHLLSSLMVFTAGRLFLYFWVLYMVCTPIANKFIRRFQNLFQYIHLPIPPLWPGILMILNFVLAGIFEEMTQEYPIDTYGSISEIKETIYALIITFWASYWTYEKTIEST